MGCVIDHSVNQHGLEEEMRKWRREKTKRTTQTQRGLGGDGGWEEQRTLWNSALIEVEPTRDPGRRLLLHPGNLLYHFDHKFTGCYALPHELAQSVVHGPLWCVTEIFLSSSVQVHDSFWPRSRLSNHISAATVTLGLLYVSLRVCRQCHMQSDSSATVEIFFEIGALCCHKFIANLWPLRSRNRFSSLSNVTRHWTYGRNGTVYRVLYTEFDPALVENVSHQQNCYPL